MATAQQYTEEAYEAAMKAWQQARDRMDAAGMVYQAADQELDKAEDELAAQEAAPGIAAWSHAHVTADRCRIGRARCSIHGSDHDEDPF